ncbi:unnamed protein product [Didymodactylos carnosus]|uniref:WWE domain-containing protein n=1 Tax=Didymodactylos carnosus TaxID=1234261 RepID=A0A815HKT7_9BILA|nr:unnamed protein product [Didymodactylos carnosus]CAF1498904.1 unnamed protein product [Didymodactylos carnosus]CAF4225685.1 unnamed protein product [Didymodactylos carnosus]CAF4287575.1 unnamed protein product [Didymodactylos carnosus]
MGTACSSTSSVTVPFRPTILPSTVRTIVWSWQSNPDPWNEKETKEWKRYSDFENEFIEEKYQKKESEAHLGNYVIDLKEMVQIKKDSSTLQRPVKREKLCVTQFVREERFAYADQAIGSFTDAYDWGSRFIGEWRKRNEVPYVSGIWSEIVEQAAAGDNFTLCSPLVYSAIDSLFDLAGILKEGRQLDQEFDAQQMAEKLRQMKDKSEDEIYECIVRLYSAESFLYKLVNRALRSEDMTKVDTLGAYACLLNRYFRISSEPEKRTLYRGATLTNKMIDEYEQATGTMITWRAFTSTSESRELAEQFGNTLFIIQAKGLLNNPFKDISSLSHYPHEQEVLFPPGHWYWVNKVERAKKNGRHLIYLSN